MRFGRYFLWVCLLSVVGFQGSCGDSADMAMVPAPDCFAMPTTHLEIINSCDTGVSYDIPVTLAKLAPGAPLMPLP